MKTLQQQYNLIKEGKGDKIQFLKQAKSLFPQYFNQYTDFDTATRVLKSKQIISEGISDKNISKGFDIKEWKKLNEEAKAVEKEISKEAADANKNAFQPSDTKNADNVNFNEIMKGFYAELKDEKNAKKTGDEIKAMVVKNLAKDPLYYTKDGMFGVKGLGFTDGDLGKKMQPKSKESSVLGGHDKVDSESDVVKNSINASKKNVQDSLSDSEANTSMPSKVKEVELTPKTAPGVKKMPMPGKEKKIKLKEGQDPNNFELGQEDPEDAPDGVNDKKASKPMKAKVDIKSTLEKIATPVFTEKDLNKAKTIFKSHIESSGINEKDKNTILKNIELAKTKFKLDSYLANSLLHYEGMGTSKLKEGIEEYNNMSDAEIIQWAYDDGFEDFVQYDENDKLANREEVLKAILGLEDTGSEEEFDDNWENEMFGPDEFDPAGGKGLSSHLEENEDAVNPAYTHFAVHKTDNKIVNGWDYGKDLDKESIREYCKMDLKDQFPDNKPSEFIILTKRGCEQKGIDPFDWKNWKNGANSNIKENTLRSLIRELIQEELNESTTIEDFVDVLIDMAVQAGIKEVIDDIKNNNGEASENIIDTAIEVYDDLFDEYEENGQGISTSDYNKAFNEFILRVKNLNEEKTELFSPETEIFLDKVKKENPDKVSRFRGLISNRGLEAAKEIYKEIDPEEIKNKKKLISKEKKNLKKREWYAKNKNSNKQLKKYANHDLDDIERQTYNINLSEKEIKDIIHNFVEFLPSNFPQAWQKLNTNGGPIDGNYYMLIGAFIKKFDDKFGMGDTLQKYINKEPYDEYFETLMYGKFGNEIEF